MDTPEGDASPHPPFPPLTQPPRAQPHRAIDVRAKTQVPGEKKKGARAMKLAGRGGSLTQWGQKPTRNEDGTPQQSDAHNDSADSQDECEATPTPAGKKKGEQLVGDGMSSDNHPAVETDIDDPYGVRNTSQTQDPVYATGGDEWDGFFNTESDAEAQRYTEAKGAHPADSDPFSIPDQLAREKVRGNKRQRVDDSPSYQDKQERVALPAPAQPDPSEGGCEVPDGALANGEQQTNDQLQREQTNGEVLPPYVPPPNEQRQPQLHQFVQRPAQEPYTQYTNQPMVHAPQPPPHPTTNQLHAAQTAHQHQAQMLNVHLAQPQLFPQTYVGQAQEGARALALLRAAARRYRCEAVTRLAKEWCITPAYADELIGAPYAGGILGALTAAPNEVFAGGHAGAAAYHTPSTTGSMGRGVHTMPVPAEPWMTQEANQWSMRVAAGQANTALNDPPRYLQMGPNRGNSDGGSSYQGPGRGSMSGDRTRDPRQRPPATRTERVQSPDYEWMDDGPRPQQMEVDGPQYQTSNLGEDERSDEDEGPQERGYGDDEVMRDHDYASDGQDAQEPEPERTARTEAQYSRALRELGAMTRPAGGFPEVHVQSVSERVRHISERDLADWRRRSPEEERCLIFVFGEGGLDQEAATKLSNRMEYVFEVFLGHRRFRLDPPTIYERGRIPRHDPALAWRLSNIEPLAKRVLVHQFGVSTTHISFHVYGEEYKVPLLLTGLDGFTQKSGVERDIRDAFRDERIVETIENLIRGKKRQSAVKIRNTAMSTIAGLRVETRHAVKDNEESPFTAYVYINIPGADPTLWEEWKNDMASLLEVFGTGGRISLHRADRCRGCHAMDHELTYCPYRLEPLKKWNARALERSAPATQGRGNAYPTKQQYQTNDRWTGSENKKGQDDRRRGHGDNRNDQIAGPSHGGGYNNDERGYEESRGRGYRQSTNRSRTFNRP
ncbi:hypothetical protein TRAPUB_7854 [Trametes pubescens]|uniref:Uncharacterized protein n=1 Tax=Trametes pubescens TaxID=154538 RepID=A0A1M2V2J1_TRAPU|nr:hypothetical protein TRAPUB_7854 [Trametes pubescens]